MRAHNKFGHPLSSTTESTSVRNYTSATNSSSLTPNRDTLNTTASVPLNDSLHQNTVAPLFVPEQPVDPITTNENQILMQLLLQRLPAIATYETLPIQSPFTSPISVYQPTSKFPDFVEHALIQQINPSSTSLKSRGSTAETISYDRTLPSSPYSPMLINPITVSNTVRETEPTISPNDITTFNSNPTTSPTVVEPILESEQEFLNTPTPNTVLKNSATSTNPQLSSSPCPECNSSSSTQVYA